MSTEQIKTPIILSVVYFSLCVLAFIFHLVTSDMFSLMFVGILTLPWSICYALFKDIVIAGIFNYELEYMTHYSILILSVVVNTALIFFITNKIIG
jgi:hypothetical protein